MAELFSTFVPLSAIIRDEIWTAFHLEWFARARRRTARLDYICISYVTFRDYASFIYVMQRGLIHCVCQSRAKCRSNLCACNLSGGRRRSNKTTQGRHWDHKVSALRSILDRCFTFSDFLDLRVSDMEKGISRYDPHAYPTGFCILIRFIGSIVLYSQISTMDSSLATWKVLCMKELSSSLDERNFW